MRRIAIILSPLFILLFVVCSGCVRQPREIDSLSEYSIVDLRNCFEATIPEQSQSYPSVLYYQQVSYDAAMSSFGSCVLRSIEARSGEYAYTAYRVAEGGVYYVQWSLDENGSPNECIDRVYLLSLPKAGALKKVRRGDPYSKLAEIDQNSSIILRSAFEPIAYSLASNGKVFGFELDASQGDEDDWIVVKISDCTEKDIFLSLLLKCDYPV